jgi:hypothetical protein
MDININFSITTQASKESTPGTLDVTKLPYRRLKSIQPTPKLRRTGACAKNCVPVRNPLGYVGYYAPALAGKLRLALHHI